MKGEDRKITGSDDTFDTSILKRICWAQLDSINSRNDIGYRENQFVSWHSETRTPEKRVSSVPPLVACSKLEPVT